MKILILNGNPESGNDRLNNYIKNLSAEIIKKGSAVTKFDLRDMKIEYCKGCMSCWFGDPGKCVVKDDVKKILKEWVSADFVILFSPVKMGFTSSLLKKGLDKLLPIVLPYFELQNKKILHKARYKKYPEVGLIVNPLNGTDEEDIAIINNTYDYIANKARSPLAFTHTIDSTASEVLNEINRV